MADDNVDAADAAIWGTLYEHMWELWIGPAVEERGAPVTPATLRKVVIEVPPGDPVSIRLDDEAAIEASVTATRSVEAGEEVSSEDIAELHSVKPIGLGENSAWVCFFRLPDGRTWIAFDFTYNRAQARTLLERSAEFLATARDKAEVSIAVSLDAAFSAAELTVQAHMLAMQQETDNHKVRGKWLAGWSENGNSPQEHASTLWRLGDLRKKARYGTDPVNVKPGQLDKMLDVVEDMLAHAKAGVEPSAQASGSRSS